MKSFSRPFVFGIFALTFALAVSAGDRMGNGGDVRRFRAAWAIRQVKETARLGDALRSNPSGYPAGCARALDLGRADDAAFARIEAFVTSTTYEWNADPGLRSCVQVYGAETTRPRFVFSYSRCPRTLAGRQIVYLILDGAVDALRLEPAVADRFAIFGNALRAPTCLSIPPDVTDGDRLFDIGEFESPGGFARRLARIQSRLLYRPENWIRSDPRKHFKTWAEFLDDANLDPASLPQDEVYAEIKAWNVKSVARLPQCSQTELKRFATIEISPTDCGTVSNEDEFQWLLLHETAHHFGYDNEASADRFAQAFSNLDAQANPIIPRRK